MSNAAGRGAGECPRDAELRAIEVRKWYPHEDQSLVFGVIIARARGAEGVRQRRTNAVQTCVVSVAAYATRGTCGGRDRRRTGRTAEYSAASRAGKRRGKAESRRVQVRVQVLSSKARVARLSRKSSRLSHGLNLIESTLERTPELAHEAHVVPSLDLRRLRAVPGVERRVTSQERGRVLGEGIESCLRTTGVKSGHGSIGSGADRHSVQFSENATRSMLERLARRCVASSTGVTVRRE